MKNFKLTPLIVFLILLIVLAISIYMRNSYYVEGVENMFNNKGQFSEFILPEYSQTAPLTQLTETIFYDKKNGNIVESVVEWKTVETAPVAPTQAVDAPTPEVAAPTPEVAAPTPDGDVPATEGHENMGPQTPILKQLIITPRNGAESYIYNFTQPVSEPLPTQESLINTMENSCVTWSYVSQSEFAPETTVFYIPWKNDTYVSIYEKSDNKMTPRGVFHFSKDRQSVINVEKVEIANSTNTQDDNNNKFVRNEKYGEHDLYQVDKFVLYDVPTSNLIVRKEHNTGSIDIYNGEGKLINVDIVKNMYDNKRTHENQEKYAELKAWTALDGQGENIITYVKNVDKTLVFICGFESSTMDSLVLKNVKKFTLYGMDNCETIEKPTPSAESVAASCDKKETKEDTKKETKEEAKSEDYILKTQIVPPVCPTCPMCPTCPKNVTCTNCGGNGGSGTKTSNGKSIIGETVGEATDLTRDAVGGAVGLGRDAVGGAVGLGREIVGGAAGLVRDVTGGAFGLIRDVGSGVAGILTPEQQQQQQQQQQQLMNGGGRMAYQQTGVNGGQYYGTNNNYSRYGMLPERPSNFIPRTADFSAFA